MLFQSKTSNKYKFFHLRGHRKLSILNLFMLSGPFRLFYVETCIIIALYLSEGCIYSCIYRSVRVPRAKKKAFYCLSYCSSVYFMAPLDFSRDKLAMWKLNGQGRNVKETKVISALPTTAVQRRGGAGFNQPSNLIYIDFTTYMFDFYYCNNWGK